MIFVYFVVANLSLAFAGMGDVPYQQPKQERSDFQSYANVQLGSDKIADGWLALFDGKSLFGWRSPGKASADWAVDSGTVKVTTGEQCLLRTAAQFDDFILELEFFAPPETNSGVFIRTSPKPTDLIKDCMEINIAPDSNPYPTGSIVGHVVGKPVQLDHSIWNRMRIAANRRSIKVWINDELVTDYQTPTESPGKGFIGLQLNSGEVRYRNVFLQPLNLRSLLGNSELNGWNVAESRESAFDLANSVLQVKSGPGQLETKQSFGNFIFSTHVRTNADGLNSGVFFRCIPGDFMNGYESQIQNQFKNGDRKAPQDAGTGAIFRRQNARIVNADDQHWLAKTIIADGATICVWVNGLQVTDWSDKRKPHDNPRKGQRLKPGTIILQGHDPTTDIHFKQMHVRELMPRR